MTLSYWEEYISGVIGERRITKEFAKGLIFQIAAFYSYDEVKMVFIYLRTITFAYRPWILLSINFRRLMNHLEYLLEVLAEIDIIVGYIIVSFEEKKL